MPENQPASKLTPDEIEQGIDRLIATSLYEGLRAMIDSGEINAALIGKAMEWRDGKGRRNTPGSGGSEANPMEQALRMIREGRAQGGAIPPLTDEA